MTNQQKQLIETIRKQGISYVCMSVFLRNALSSHAIMSMNRLIPSNLLERLQAYRIQILQLSESVFVQTLALFPEKVRAIKLLGTEDNND